MRRAVSLILAAAAVFVAAAGLNVKISEQKEYVVIEKVERLVREEIESEENKECADLTSFKKINKDTAALLEMGDIYLPVVKSRDNDEYLHKDFFGNDSKSGCLFISMLNNEDFTDRNTVIYGHNMRIGTMFGSLKKYLDETYFNQNPDIKVHIDGKTLKYKIIGTGKLNDGSKSYLPDPVPGEGGLESYLEEVISGFEIKRKYNKSPSRILTLSTCTFEGGDKRLVLLAVLEE